MIINGKEYSIPEIKYNTICELEKYDVNLLSGEVPSAFLMLRGFLALVLKNKVVAGEELEKHIIENGMESLNDAFAEITKAIEDSGFLAKMRAKAEKEKQTEAKQRKAAKSLPNMEK